MQKKILVTGGCGFIGSKLIKELLRHNYEVFNIDKKAEVSANSFNIDLAERENTFNLISYIKPDIIFHLAANTQVRDDDIYSDFENNVKSTINVLEACKNVRIKKFVITSSAAVYGDNQNFPLKETEILNPISSYGLSKKIAELYCNYYSKAYQVPVCIFRLSNVYGFNIKNPVFSKGVISEFILKIHNGKEINVFGDGSQTRDYIYVQDVIDAFLKLIEKPAVGTFNLSTNNETSINQLIEILEKLTNLKIKVINGPRKENEIARSVLSNSKIKEILDWTPNYSLEKGIMEMIDFIKKGKINHGK